MAKRKAGVNNIIYELDNEDIEVSSDDEVKEPKTKRLETVISPNTITTDDKIEETGIENVTVDKSDVKVSDVASSTIIQNGGKMSVDFVSVESQNVLDSVQNEDVVDCVKKPITEICKTTILNEDIVIDSPGNSDLGVEGCENKTPLITVRFKNNKLAVNYKQQIKAFMLNLIRQHEGDSQVSDSETDLELDIWPEDLNEELPDIAEEKVEDNLFFVDTDPGDDRCDDVPRYSQTSTVISNVPEKEPTPPPAHRGRSCFNCDGNHGLRDCPKPKDFARIANKRKSLPVRVGRYHVEDEQKFGHLIPGRLSGQLRHALGLKRHELPLHIYRMRLLGYPPGWLEEARISHSGIAMFDSSGNAILEADDEEGEFIEPGSKDKFDIKKILDFPGFNVLPSPRYKEEAHIMGLPPMADQDSKMAMLQFLAPNAMKAYKRKKLTMFPSADSKNTTIEGQTEMELDSGDELTEFPSVPPLPDEAPPPPPPPPSCPPPVYTPPPLPTSSPPLPSPQKEDQKEEDRNSEDDVEVIEVLKVGDIPIPMADFIVIDEDDSEVDKTESSSRASPSLDDLEAKKQLLLNALEVTDITVIDKTEESLEEITDISINDAKENEDKRKIIDKVSDDNTIEDKAGDDNENAEKVTDDNANADNIIDDINTDNNGTANTNAPEVIVRATNDENVSDKDANVGDTSVSNKPEIPILERNSQDTSPSIPTQVVNTQESSSQVVDTQVPLSDSQVIDSQETNSSCEVKSIQDSSLSPQLLDSQESVINLSQLMASPTNFDSSIAKTPDSKTGLVKDTEYGTPVLNIASSYVKLPSDDKFAKNICDIINFENLPNSTGKYKKISALLKKVKSEVDRIQDS
ncbi:unnamed protein product [Arctia plantaginis]|uniref:PSP proline-rich domain-containing protein n=1 Tax=Arctia plantaginis TaxID=874455 RepID=A0A8S0ZSJ1_ARCPL|nr:unnamed protein product [Arctia plantaginis]